MKYKWKYRDTVNNNYYHDEDGRIVGEILRINFSDNIWHADVNGDSLGNYIDESSAMVAVENLVRKNEEDLILYQKEA